MAGFGRHRWGIVIALLVGALAVAAAGGILSADASKRHNHKVGMVYKEGSKFLPATSSGEVDFVLLFCPRGTKVTGVGSSTDGLGYVNEQEIDPGTNSGTAFYVDQFVESTTIRAQIACVKHKTSKTRAKTTASARRAVQQADRAKVARLKATLTK